MPSDRHDARDDLWALASPALAPLADGAPGEHRDGSSYVFGDAERTRRIITAVQREGTCWCGGTVWQGRPAMPVSVFSWATTEADIDRSLAAVVRCARDAG